MLGIARRKRYSIDPRDLSKVQWKVAEAVHLGFDFIFLRVSGPEEASDVIDGNNELLDIAQKSANPLVWKFHVKESAVTHYANDVIPSLPEKWWTIPTPWENRNMRRFKE